MAQEHLGSSSTAHAEGGSQTDAALAFAMAGEAVHVRRHGLRCRNLGWILCDLANPGLSGLDALRLGLWRWRKRVLFRGWHGRVGAFAYPVLGSVAGLAFVKLWLELRDWPRPSCGAAREPALGVDPAELI